MKTHLTRTLATAVAAVALLSSCFGTVGYYGEYDASPPAAYIATATPVYYNGYPWYWYGDRWYCREGARWRMYRDEPAYLRDYRVHAAVPVVRQSYGRTEYYARPPEVHGAVRVGGGYHQAVPVRHR
jgi:hypothetical protein